MSFTLIDLSQGPFLFSSFSSRTHFLSQRTILLNTYYLAQWAGKQPTVDTFSAPALRAPEIILHSDFGPKIDIWAVGCLTFELLVGRWLFNPEDGGVEDWRFKNDHLAKILELTGEQFSESVLDRALLRQEYFDDEGKLGQISFSPLLFLFFF